MIDQKFDSPPVPKEKKMSKRDFLKLSACAAGELVLFGLVNRYRDDILKIIDRIGLSPEAKRMMSETTAFRESLGLEGLPAEYKPGLLKKTDWSSDPDNYLDALPEKNKSYSLRILEVIQILFGNNATRNIKGSKADPQYPYGMSFEHGSRFCNVADSVHDIPLQVFIDFILHEAGGHGSDPGGGASYPPEIFTRVEHGKWRALSQALSIPDQFLNHPRDLMFPFLKKSIGEAVGRFMTGDQNSPIVDAQSVLTVRQEVAGIARVKGKDIKTLKFNKAVCKETGEVLVALLREGKIEFTGGLKKTYQDKMEDACIEIYAEMFKYALLFPEKMQNNCNVIGGITEVISAIKGDANIAELRKQITKPSADILKRYEAEKAMLKSETPTTTSSPVPTLLPEEQERISKQQKEFGMLEKAFQDFGDKGEILATLIIPERQKEIVQRFATLYSKMIQKYPMLKDTFSQEHNESFDPEMHIWEIREVETAMESGFVRKLIASQDISGQIINDISHKVEVIEKFVNSPAF